MDNVADVSGVWLDEMIGETWEGSKQQVALQPIRHPDSTSVALAKTQAHNAASKQAIAVNRTLVAKIQVLRLVALAMREKLEAARAGVELLRVARARSQAIRAASAKLVTFRKS